VRNILENAFTKYWTLALITMIRTSFTGLIDDFKGNSVASSFLVAAKQGRLTDRKFTGAFPPTTSFAM
jgi:hypothetical protein